jgi:hypothetical protein
MILRSWLTVSALVVAALPVTAGAAAAGTGDPVASSAKLPVSRVTDAVVDPVHHKAFVSSRAEGRVVVVDLLTGASTRLPYLAGAAELAVDPAGENVWVSLQAEGEVARISTSPPHAVRRYDLGAYSCPGELVATSDLVAVLTDTCDRQWEDLRLLDPETGTATLSEAPPFATVFDAELRAVPGTDHVVWQSTGITSPDVGIVDTDTDELVALADDRFVVAAGPTGLLDASGEVLSPTTLQPVDTWSVPVDEYFELIHSAVGPDDLLALPVGPGAAVHDLETGATLQRWQASPTGLPRVHRVMWDGGVLLGVTDGVSDGGPVTLFTVPDPTGRNAAVIEADDPGIDDPMVRPGSTWTATGRLLDAAGDPIAGATVEVLDPDGLRGTTTTAMDGTWSVEVIVNGYLLRAYFPGDAEHGASAVSLRPPIGQQEYLTVDAPTSVAPTDPVVYTGTVLAQDGSPFVDHRLNVSWSCGGRGFDGVVLTDDAGAFRYETEAPRCNELVVYFNVDGYYGWWGRSGATQMTTDVGWSTADLQASGPAHLVPGDTGTWTATLTVDGQPLADAVLSFSAQESSRTETGTVTTDASGTAVLTTDAFDAGVRQVRFRYPGNAVTLGATATVVTTVDRWASTLTAAAATDPALAGSPVVIDGTLVLGDAAPPGGRIVTVRTPGSTVFDEPTEPLDSAVVDAEGRFELIVQPDVSGSMRLVVGFAGDSRHAPRELILDIPVETRPTTVSSQVAGRPAADERARVVAAADPGYAGMCLTHRLERRTRDGWRTVVTSGCRHTDERGRSFFRTPGLKVGGYRVRAAFGGDERTAAERGDWKRFTVR